MCKLKSNSRTTNDHSGSDGQSNASSNNDYGYERDWLVYIYEYN